AATRTETRGSHWREDFGDRDDAHWLGRILTRLDPEGELIIDVEPMRPAP
ncbi:hypothetical protein, partial [Frankia sp. AvcI1]